MRIRTLAAAVTAALLLGVLSASACADGDRDSDRAFGARKNANACQTADTVYFLCDESVAGGMTHSVIRYLDKTTGAMGPLCGRPECTHTDADCSAYAEGSVYGIATYSGRLYWVALDGRNRYMVYSAALDGTDRRTVRQLDGDLMPARMNDWSFQFHRGRIYLSCIKSEVTDGVVHESDYIVGYPLEPDGAGFVILDEEASAPRLSVQLFGSGMYIVDTCRANGGRKSQPRFRRWDVETGEMEVLFDGQPPFTGGISDCWVTEDSIYMVESHAVGGEQYERSGYRYDLAGSSFQKTFSWFTGGPCTMGVADDLCVAVDSSICDRLAITAADFQGNTLLEAQLPVEGMPAGLDFLMLSLAGADEREMYFYSGQPAFFAAVARDGSGARVLWP